MSASFPGENLSLARSDSQGPPLSQHVIEVVQTACQPIGCRCFSSNLAHVNDLLIWPPSRLRCCFSTKAAGCLSLLQQYATVARLEIVLGHFAAECVAVNAKQFGCVSLVIPRLLECLFDCLALDILEVEGADSGLERRALRLQRLAGIGCGGALLRA